MSNYLVQVVLEHDSGLPEDRSINTYSCQTTATPGIADLTEFVTDLHAFYLAIDTYLSSLLSGAVQYRCYDRADPTPRVPVLIIDETLTVGATTSPLEVALCMSFQAVQVSGESQARRRGRTYLGPLSASALNTTTGRPDSAMVTAMVSAADTLLGASVASTDYNWEVWSQVLDSGVAVDNGWIDNDFDTQRRRSLKATSRTTFDG